MWNIAALSAAYVLVVDLILLCLILVFGPFALRALPRAVRTSRRFGPGAHRASVEHGEPGRPAGVHRGGDGIDVVYVPADTALVAPAGVRAWGDQTAFLTAGTLVGVVSAPFLGSAASVGVWRRLAGRD